MPAPLDAMGSLRSGALDEFRIHSPVEVQALLKQLQDSNALLHLSTSDGVSYTTTLWAQDRARGILSFSADARDPRLLPLLESDEAVVVGYADNIKLQFDARKLVLVQSARAAAINAAYPYEIFRFQRRGCYRVRPLARSMAVAAVPTSQAAGGRMQLRVIDVSLTGVGLFLPDSAPRPRPGDILEQVSLQLDAETQLNVNLEVRHVTVAHPDHRGARMGCEMLDLSRDAARELQRYIDRTQAQRRMLT
ncbi:MAG TPA: flagellar regulator YcgR PilZN domain-containing protein [Methylibium sp.]